MQSLELKSGMRGVGLKARVSRSRPLLNVARQFGELAAKRWVQSRDHNWSGSSGSHSPRRSDSKMSWTRPFNFCELAAVD